MLNTRQLIAKLKIIKGALPTSVHCTEVRFASFLSGGFITVIVVNPLELGMYFDAVVVEVKTVLLLFRLALAILCILIVCPWPLIRW
jgi:hypothetical protein